MCLIVVDMFFCLCEGPQTRADTSLNLFVSMCVCVCECEPWSASKQEDLSRGVEKYFQVNARSAEGLQEVLS